MESPETQDRNVEGRLAECRAAMDKEKAAELAGNGRAHLVGSNKDPNLFHSEELTDEDAAVWEAIKKGIFTIPQYKAYEQKMFAEGIPKGHPRDMFRAYMANYIMYSKKDREGEE